MLTSSAGSEELETGTWCNGSRDQGSVEERDGEIGNCQGVWDYRRRLEVHRHIKAGIRTESAVGPGAGV